MSNDGSVDLMDMEAYKLNYPEALFEFATDANFLTYQKNEIFSEDFQEKTTQPIKKPIPITLESLLIRAEELSRIAQIATRELGKLEAQEWMSSMLLDLNEASTFFFSNSVDPDRKRIHAWFMEKWSEFRLGDDVINQAVYAIMPDSFYRDAPSKYKVKPEIRSKYNDYASTALIIINELAQDCWQEANFHIPRRKYRSRKDIIEELNAQGFTAKLAGAVSSFIRPKKRT